MLSDLRHHSAERRGPLSEHEPVLETSQNYTFDTFYEKNGTGARSSKQNYLVPQPGWHAVVSGQRESPPNGSCRTSNVTAASELSSTAPD